MCSPSQRSCLVTTPTVTCTQVVNTRRHVPFSSVADYTDIFWAQHYCQCGQPDKARNKLTTALAHFTRTQDAVGIGKSLNGLSAVSLAQGCYDRALAYSQAATAILEDTDAKHDYAIALYQLGVSHFELQHWPQAEKNSGTSTDTVLHPIYPGAGKSHAPLFGTSLCRAAKVAVCASLLRICLGQPDN